MARERDPSKRIGFLQKQGVATSVPVPPAPPEAAKAIEERQGRVKQVGEGEAIQAHETPGANVAPAMAQPAVEAPSQVADPVVDSGVAVPGQEEEKGVAAGTPATEEKPEQQPAPVAIAEAPAPSAPEAKGGQGSSQPTVNSATDISGTTTAPTINEPAPEFDKAGPLPKAGSEAEGHQGEETKAVIAAPGPRMGRPRIYNSPLVKIMVRLPEEIDETVQDIVARRRKTKNRSASANQVYVEWIELAHELARLGLTLDDVAAMKSFVDAVDGGKDKNEAAQAARKRWLTLHPEPSSTKPEATANVD